MATTSRFADAGFRTTNTDHSNTQYGFEPAELDMSNIPDAEQVDEEGYYSRVERDLDLINQDLDMSNIPDSEDFPIEF